MVRFSFRRRKSILVTYAGEQFDRPARMVMYTYGERYDVYHHYFQEGVEAWIL